MKWSYILFVPAVISAAWALATMLFKRRPTHAQLILSFMLLLESFAMIVISVFFRGRAGSLFIYDYLFITTTMFSLPLYYVGICSLTEPRGATLRQRRTFLIPILYVLGLTYCAFWLGPRRYEEMCHALRDGTATWIAGDMAWNAMYFWAHILFPTLFLISSLAIMIQAARKSRIFSQRFNTFYAQGIHVPKINNGQMFAYTVAFLIVAIGTVALIDFRPRYYKYGLIVCTVLITALQFIIGRYIYHLDYDARYVANLVKEKQS